MKVSVVTVCRNAQNTIEACLRSVQSQSYENIEHVIIDGASADDTLNVIYRQNIQNLIVLSQPDQGIYDAMNKGVNLSTGDIVCFLNSDDVYSDSEVIEEVVHQIKFKNLDVLLTDVCFLAETGEVTRSYSARDFVPQKLESGWMPPHPGMFVAKKKIFEAGLFNAAYKIAGDYELCIRLFKLPNLSWSYYPRRTVAMALGGVSTSGIKSIAILNYEVYQACRQNGKKISILSLFLKYPKKILELYLK